MRIRFNCLMESKRIHALELFHKWASPLFEFNQGRDWLAISRLSKENHALNSISTSEKYFMFSKNVRNTNSLMKSQYSNRGHYIMTHGTDVLKIRNKENFLEERTYRFSKF